MAKAGQMDAVKIMAKDLVRTRKAIKKFMLNQIKKYCSVVRLICHTQQKLLRR